MQFFLVGHGDKNEIAMATLGISRAGQVCIPIDSELATRICAELLNEKIKELAMCWCNPNIRTPWCGKPECDPLKQPRHERVETLGQVAYEAYCRQTGGKSIATGCDLPKWSALKLEIREAWDAAAVAVLDAGCVACPDIALHLKGRP